MQLSHDFKIQRHYVDSIPESIICDKGFVVLSRYRNPYCYPWIVDSVYEYGYIIKDGVTHIYICCPTDKGVTIPVNQINSKDVPETGQFPDGTYWLPVDNYRHKGKPYPLAYEFGRRYKADGTRVEILVYSDEDIAGYNMHPELVEKQNEALTRHDVGSIHEPADKEDEKLKDTGNRTNLGGTGGLRDINPENGRCDLLPATAVRELMNHQMFCGDHIKKPALLNALTDIMLFIENADKEDLFMAVYRLAIQNCLNKYHELPTPEFALADCLLDLSIHYRKGAEKYAERNWEKGLPIHSFIDSAIRHLCKEIKGMTDEPHLIACMWNLMGAVWTMHHHPELNDMPDYTKNTKGTEPNACKEEETDKKTDTKAEIHPRVASPDNPYPSIKTKI